MHVENEPQQQLFVRQTSKLMGQCYLLADKVVRSSGVRMGMTGAELNEFLAAAVPGVASQMFSSFFNLSSMLNGAPQKDIDAIYDSVEAVLQAIKKEIESK